MLRTLFAVSPLLLASAGSLASIAQERVKKKEAKDFPALLETAKTSWDAGQYGAVSKALSDAQKLVTAKRRAGIVAAFPPAPEGWKFEPAEVDESAAMLVGFTGLTVEGFYRGPARERISISAMIESPMMQMMSMMIQNPAALGKDAELIKYGEHSAVLQKNGDKRFELSVVIGKTILKADCNGVTDDELLKLMSQAAIDRFEAALNE